MTRLLEQPTPHDDRHCRACEHPDEVAQVLAELRARLNGVLLGKPDVVDDVVACLLAGQHVLLEDLPGLGKTTLAKALARAVGGTFGRLQCTPDLLPADVTGFSVLNQKSREFEFLPGPVFADVLLVDEINRATPRTQSALLEAMAERQVSVDGQQHALSPTFFVIATQNPLEHAGTYPLPEAQLDRFGMKLSIGYPAADHELAMLARAVLPRLSENQGPPPEPRPVLAPGELKQLQRHTAAVAVVEPVRRYIVALGTATRSHPELSLGLSPRALLTWLRLAQARAVVAGRTFVSPADVQAVAAPTLGVRLLRHDAGPVAPAVERILADVEVPI